MNKAALKSDNPLQELKGTHTSHNVTIKVVKGVLDFDYPQARVTWEALLNAGIEPGDLVANALNLGHGYQIDEHKTEAVFNVQNNSLLSESQTSEGFLVGYSYVRQRVGYIKNLLDSASSSTQNGLVYIEKDLTVEDFLEKNLKSVEITAIVRDGSGILNPSQENWQRLILDKVDQVLFCW